jgi:hypothetical protein
MSEADIESFFGESSDAPAYLKFEEGKTKIRVLGDFVLGWEGWYQGKPVRTGPHEMFDNDEKALLEKTKAQDGSEYPKYKQFAAALVWNYNLSAVQIWEFTQKSITKQLMALKSNPDWGDVRSFDLTVERKGKGFDTEYNITPTPKNPLAKEIASAIESTRLDPKTLLTDEKNRERVDEIRVKAGTLVKVKDTQGDVQEIYPAEEIDPADIPF